MKKIFLLLFLFGIIFLFGCTQTGQTTLTQKEYVCPNGEIVSDSSFCNISSQQEQIEPISTDTLKRECPFECCEETARDYAKECPQGYSCKTLPSGINYCKQNLDEVPIADSPQKANNTETQQTNNSDSGYICSYNAYNCSDFQTQAQAQTVLETCGASQDIHYLDADKDGIACETLPR